MCQPPNDEKVPYWSQACADNAVWLHKTLHRDPEGNECALIEAYRCGDHWHIGHARTTGGLRGQRVCPPPDRTREVNDEPAA